MDIEIENKINTLAVDDSWKTKFRTLAEAEPISFGLIPKFKNEAIYKNSPITTKMNFWALLFGVFYYIAKGMWKKGIVLVAIGFGVNVLLTLLFGEKAGNSASYGIMAIFAAFANFDYYRKMVLGEDFWI